MDLAREHTSTETSPIQATDEARCPAHEQISVPDLLTPADATLAASIIGELDRPKAVGFELLRTRMQNHKSLWRADFNALITLLEKDPLSVLAFKNLTAGELHLLSKALQRAKVRDANVIVKFLLSEEYGAAGDEEEVDLDAVEPDGKARRKMPQLITPFKRVATLLLSIIGRGCALTDEPLNSYVHDMIKKPVGFLHYKILLAVARKYPRLMSDELRAFCAESEHPICQAIMKM